MRRTPSQRYCLFERAGYRFAVPVDGVREVLRPTRLARLPGTPPEVLGIAAVRGGVLPVVQIDDWLYLPRRGLRAETPILTLEAAGVRMGIVVDRVLGAATLPPAEGGRETFGTPAVCGRTTWGELPVVCLDVARLIETALDAVRVAAAEWRRARLGESGGLDAPDAKEREDNGRA